MSNRAWMPLHLDAYLADTGHLTTLEHGAYLLLIMHYWRNGSLPDDERMIARIARLSKDEWAESRDVLATLFREGWKHKRIDEELAKADDIIAKRKAAAGAMHSKRTAKADAPAEQMQSTCSDTGGNTFNQEPIRKEEPTGSSKKRGTRLPDDFHPDMAAADDAGLSQADAGREALKFRDYWISQPGQRGVKTDWPATWRNWCRTAAERRPSQRSTSPPKKPTIGDMFRQDAQRMGVIPNDQITSPPDRRLADRDARGEGSGSGIARRFALPANLLGDVGQS